MHSYDLILTLTGGLGSALVLGYITQRIGLSPIVGYLLAGLLVGPYTPGFVANAGLAEQLAEIGVILLMFGVGLQFRLDELLAVRRIAIPGALAQSAVATLLGALLAVTLGWTWPAGIVFGMALAVASTVVLVRVLADNNDLHTSAGHIAVGWLVVEDLFTVLALVLLPAIFGPASSLPLWQTIAMTTIKVGALVAFTAIVGTRLLPALLEYISRTRSRELFTLTVLVMALGIAVSASLVFGVSMALGAFLAGMVVGRSEFSLRAAADALPMRDAFAVLFFVSVGMLLDPLSLVAAPALTIGAVLIVIVAKPLVALVIALVMGYPLRTSLTVAIALAQIGEFSFILSTIGRDLGLLSSAATNALVGASIISIVLNPILYRAMKPFERWLLTRGRTGRPAAPPPPPRSSDARHRAVVVGFGPTGRAVVKLLQENGVAPTVIDLNLDTVRTLRENGVDAVYGDASRPETLIGARLPAASSLILTTTTLEHGDELLRAARDSNPDVRVLARANYLRDVAGLKRAGADVIYSGEGEVALAFVGDVLEHLGATPEQVDRERERARDDLLQSALGT
jgi:monovalent cation:H+ antiporter-2, CPA2 family